MSKYYFAYGSNLNKLQMLDRCKDAILIGSTYLNDYQLEFWGYLTVVKKVGAKCPIGIWEISDLDEAELDYYEGWPNSYKKETISIEFKGRLFI